MNLRSSLANFFTAAATRVAGQRLSTVTAQVDDRSSGWTQHGRAANDLSYGEQVELYQDSLEAVRKNPIAKTIVDITTEFVVGDGITIRSPIFRLRRFAEKFWTDPQNHMQQRLPELCAELTRAGDLFVVLFRNPTDGMSYIRLVTKEQILRIETAENDWETEIAYHQVTEDPMNPRIWLSPAHPAAAEAEAIMLHYCINRPVGASYGEGDIDTALPWLKRYSRMLEDRVRLNWAVRSFLWFVTVPAQRVEEKQHQYNSPPEAGSIIVKDDGEEWDVKAPRLNATDARYDLQAVRNMVDAVGFPPHWRNEPQDANLATAKAMQIRPYRRLKQRQNYFVFILEDIIYHAYRRAHEIDRAPRGALVTGRYSDIFQADVPDISREDNLELAQAGKEFMQAFDLLFKQIPAASSPKLAELVLRQLFKFLGEPQDTSLIEEIAGQAEPQPEQGSRPSGAATPPSANGTAANSVTSSLPNHNTRPGRLSKR